jgi:hypothetical protein
MHCARISTQYIGKKRGRKYAKTGHTIFFIIARAFVANASAGNARARKLKSVNNFSSTIAHAFP